MKYSFQERIKEIYRKMRVRVGIVLPALGNSTAAVLRDGMPIVLPAAAVLAVCSILQKIGAVEALMNLVFMLLALPVALAVLVYAADASWERRKVTLTDAVQLVRIRIKEILITGAVAWLIVTVVRNVIGMLLGVVAVLLGGIFALLCMIPVLGGVLAAIAAAAQWAILLLADYVSYVVLTVGMLVLIAEGISGKPQLDRAMAILKNGGKKFLEAFVLLFGVWLVVGGAGALVALIIPGVDALVMSALTVCSAIAVCVICFRDRDGIDFR